jgi:FkbH-like protein
MAELKCAATIEFAPFDQVFQQLLDANSPFGQNKKGLNVTLLRLEDWMSRETANAAASEQSTSPRALDEFISAAKGFAARGSAPHLICLCPPATATAGDSERMEQLVQMERRLCSELSDTAGVYTITTGQLQRLYPVPDYYDASADEIGKVPYTPVFFTALATMIARHFHGLKRRTHKVITLDCDNTLWSGVCGEDGAKGIHLSDPFKALQEFMRAQHDAGMLLCLCSKNNEEDVWDVFQQRLEMPLRREHFCAFRLNWESKSKNLIALARELQVGLDSFIFVDDNPVECAEVRANCPEVLVLQLPYEPEKIPAFLDHCWVFDHLKLTTEDRRRTAMYREQQQREHLRAKSLSLADFLAGLEMKILIEPMTAQQLPRVAQLTQRTNQFNLTSRRLTETDIQIQLTHSEVLTVSVSDRFGSHGLAGEMIFQAKQDSLDVDIFLLSCRVLGRGVEHRMLAHLGRLAQKRGLHWVDIHFDHSPKNKPARDFLDGIGAPFKQPLNGGFLYRFPAGYVADLVFNPPSNDNAEFSTAESPKLPPTSSATSELAPWVGAEETDISAIHDRVEAFAGERLAESRSSRQAKSDAASAATLANDRSASNGTLSGGISSSDLENKLMEIWKKLLRLDSVGGTDNFFDIGGHSLLAVRLFSEIAKVTGRKLPLVTIFRAPTINQLASELQERTTRPSRSLIVPIQPNGSRPPVFLVHGAGGDVLWGYANLASHLDPDQPVYGLKSRGQVGLEELPTLEEMASCYLQEVRMFQRKGPYYLGGYCFGGNVAYEMARQLKAQGEEVALVLLLDSNPANAGYEKVPWWQPQFSKRFARNLGLWLKDFFNLESEVRRNFVARKARAFGRRMVRPFKLGNTGKHVDLEEVIDPGHFAADELKLWQIHLDALVHHVQQPYVGRVVLLRTRGQAVLCSLAADFCWGKLVSPGIEVRIVPGSHESIFVEPNVAALGREVTQYLQSPMSVKTDHSNDYPKAQEHKLKGPA